MRQANRVKLIRILGLLGSDQDGERASAALAAHRLVTASGKSWAELLQPPAPAGTAVRTVVHRVREYGVDQQEAAEARLRQLKATNERLEREVKSLRRRVANMAERQRRREMAEAEAQAESDQP